MGSTVGWGGCERGTRRRGEGGWGRGVRGGVERCVGRGGVAAAGEAAAGAAAAAGGGARGGVGEGEGLAWAWIQARRLHGGAVVMGEIERVRREAEVEREEGGGRRRGGGRNEEGVRSGVMGEGGDLWEDAEDDDQRQGRGVRGKETVEEEEEEEEEEEGGDAEEEGLDLEEAVFEGGGGKGDSALGYNAGSLESLWSCVQHLPEGATRLLPTVLTWHSQHADGSGRPLPKALLLALIRRLKDSLRHVHAFEVGWDGRGEGGKGGRGKGGRGEGGKGEGGKGGGGRGEGGGGEGGRGGGGEGGRGGGGRGGGGRGGGGEGGGGRGEGGRGEGGRGEGGRGGGGRGGRGEGGKGEDSGIGAPGAQPTLLLGKVSEYLVRSAHYWLGKADWKLLLDVCVRAGRVTRAEEMFTLLPRDLQTEEVYMSILHNYARRGLVRRVESRVVMLRALGVRESALSFEARMMAYAVRGMAGDVERVAREMADKGIPPTPAVYEHRMQAYARRLHLPAIRALLHHLSHSPHPPSLPTLTAAAWAFFSRGKLGEAERVVGEMRTVQAGRGEGLPVPLLVGLAWAYARVGDVRRVEGAVEEAGRVKANDLSIMHMAQIYCYAVAGRVEDAEKAFSVMQQAGHAPTTAAYNCLLPAYTRTHLMHKALSLLADMRASHRLPDAITYHHLITGALHNEDTDAAVSLLLQAAAAAAAGHPWSWGKRGASWGDGPNPVLDALVEGCGSEWGVREGGSVGAPSSVGTGGWVHGGGVVGGRRAERGRRRLQVRVGLFLAVVERLAEAGDMERVERVVSEVGRGMYAMDAKLYNLVLRAVLRGAARVKVGEKGAGGIGDGRGGVERREEEGGSEVVGGESGRDGEDGGGSCDTNHGSIERDGVGLEEQGQQQRLEDGVRRVLRLLRASRTRPNAETQSILANAGLLRVFQEEGLSPGLVPR
ncbi:hypothetical protein CLOP_g14945 [Closterium sp. NIES-67]|nr:hypothetical protein CLOP_g14945 [Closterium sp. NIES-67]